MRRTADSNSASRSLSGPWLTQKKLSYLPAKALPKPSSCRLDERTMIGYWPK